MGWRPGRKRREREFAELDQWRTTRKWAADDVTDLGARLREQAAELAAGSFGHEAAHHHGLATDTYERAAAALAATKTAEDVCAIEPTLTEARYHWAATAALIAGQPVPLDRAPCFFDPRHGPSVKDVSWSPPAGPTRTIAVCSEDARRLGDGEDPLTRTIRIGDRFVAVHEVGGYRAALEHQSSLFGERNASYKNRKNQSQTDLWAPGTRFGGGGGDGGQSSSSSGAL